ncbi:MAG TPA: hypothetical protein VKD90_24410 [Gemmataceae bacterium]|nr:hypothetical protein [Gemmataceae bacterium]
MRNWSSLLAIGVLPLVLALPVGVHATAGALENGSTTALAIGLPLLAAGILGLECIAWADTLLRAEFEKSRPPTDGRPAENRAAPEVGGDLVAAVLLLIITILLYFLMLDGHVHVRACGWLYLLYAAWAAPVIAWQRGHLSGWGRRYVRSGWAPIIAFGLPLTLPTLKAAGLVPFSPVGFAAIGVLVVPIVVVGILPLVLRRWPRGPQSEQAGDFDDLAEPAPTPDAQTPAR